MAKIIEQTITIKLSKLGRDNEPSQQSLVADETVVTLEQVVQELVGSDSGVIVEINAEE